MRDYLLADDLSGALDAAAAFQQQGRRVLIVWSLASWGTAPPDAFVAYTTETRNAPPASAAATVAAFIAHAGASGGRLCFKKIDSTLRGPIAAELRAVFEAMPNVRLLFAPANPAVGRTVRRGELQVHGVPVAATDFARDPQSPILQSDLRVLLGDLPRDHVLIPDTETEADLTAAVSAIAVTGLPWLPVGSGALARAVANQGRTWASNQAPVPRAVSSGPRLFICGSAHPLNRTQADALRHQRGVASCEIRMADLAGTVKTAVAILNQSGALSLVVAPLRIDSGVALRAIAQVSAEVIALAKVTRLFVTGGESAFALCRTLEVSALELLTSIEPGVVLARAEGRAETLLMAVKPGGFGDADTWIRVWDHFAVT